MKASRDRSEQFMHTAASASVPPPATSELTLSRMQQCCANAQTRSSCRRLPKQGRVPAFRQIGKGNLEHCLMATERKTSWRLILMAMGVRVDAGATTSKCSWLSSRWVPISGQ